MRVAVLGGSGTFGSLAVQELTRRGHEALVLSRHAPAAATSGAGHRQVDVTTGAGLVEALDGVDVVIDSANAVGRRAKSVLVAGTRRTLQAGASAGVGHHVLISIVGIEDVPISYYRIKLDQERVLEDSPVPTSVFRATQFHQLLDGLFAAASRVRVLPAGRIPLQPVDPAEAASALIDSVQDGPWEGRREFVGPEIEILGRLARRWSETTGRPALRVPVPLVGRLRTGLRGGGLTSTTAPRGAVSFGDWLNRRSGHRPGHARD